MKTTKIFCIMVTAIIMLSQTRSIAQEGKGYEKKKENIEAQKVAYITTQLNLTSDEAKVFWPVYNEYETKAEAIRKEFRSSNKISSVDSLSDAKAKERITAQLKMEQDLLDLKKEYSTKFLAVLPAVKVLKLQRAEMDFKKVLLKMLKDAPKKQQK
jgi:hypothetical protein